MLYSSSTPMITFDENGTRILRNLHSATTFLKLWRVKFVIRHFNLTHAYSCVSKARIGSVCVSGYQMPGSTFRSTRQQIQLLEARKQALGRTSPHFRSQIASEKDMFDRKTIMLSYYVQEHNTAAMRP